MHLFVDKLTNIDFSYLDAKRGLLGETWLADIVLKGALDEQNMVCDFGIVKGTLRDWFDAEMDHRLLVPTLSPAVKVKQADGQVDIEWTLSNGELIHCQSPAQAIALVEAEEITADSVALWAIQRLTAFFPDSIEQLEINFVSEQIEGAFYHYSHGLKKHQGNCQRIAHGHRSRIDIWQDGEYATELTQQWAQRWSDIYLGSEEDLQRSDNSNYYFSYRAEQGEFSIRTPKSISYLMDCDTTVELIALHIAQQLKQQNPNANFTVKAFEGIGKGAIAES